MVPHSAGRGLLRRYRRYGRRTLLTAALAVLAVTGCTVGVNQPEQRNDQELKSTPVFLPQLNLPFLPWWGGPGYYAQFPMAAAAGWTDPGFFPISVFYGRPADAALMASIGVNTYMAAEYNGEPVSDITGHGIYLLAQWEWTPEAVGDDPMVVGWHISDECEMGYSGCTPIGTENSEEDKVAVQKEYADSFRELKDGRLLQANFGNGVLGTWWAPNTMPDHVALVDVTSVDKYAYTSPHVQRIIVESSYWPQGVHPASAVTYGWLQDRMETFASPPASKPNWVFVETAMPFLEEDDATTITGEQIEGAVWSAIIAGASGIAYFRHNNNGECGVYSLVECPPELRNKIKAINGKVASLAPVINTPSYDWDFGPGTRASLKVYDGWAYILAMTDGASGSRQLTLPEGVGGSVIEVVGEDRVLAVEDGSFQDNFAAEYSHHVYRVRIDP